jgi:simple sugar transport system permease protein
MAQATATPVRSDERLRQTGLVKKLLNRPELGALAGVILVYLFFLIVAGGSGMFSAKGLVNILEVSAQLGILAVAVSLLMIGGEFDLSVGSMIGAAGILVALPLVAYGWPLWLCILLAFAVAALVGFANGTMVYRTGLPSFIVTLAGLFILRGLTIGSTRALTGLTRVSGVSREIEQSGFDQAVAAIFSGKVGYGLMAWLTDMGLMRPLPNGAPPVDGIPVVIIWFLVLGALATWVLLRTRFGNWIFAVGGDKNAARNVGVPVQRVKIILFMGTAFAATLVAISQTLSVGSADVIRGELKEFEAIIAAVIGGCLLTGGYGSAVGGMLGALIFGTVQMGIFYTGVNTDWFKVFLGAMLLIAVLVNNAIRKRVTESR